LGKKVKSALSNRNFIFVLAIILGLVVGQGATFIKPLLLPLIAVAMTLTTISITNHDLTSIIRTPRTLAISLLLNYVIMSCVILLMAQWVRNDSELWAGLVTIAAMPVATNAVPFTYMLGGDTAFSLMSVAGLHLVAIALAPAMMIMFLGVDLVNPVKLFLTLLYLIIIPVAISRLLLFKSLGQVITKWQDTVVTWCYFTTIYIIIGSNRQLFFEQSDILLKVIVIAVTVTFIIGQIVYVTARKLNTDKSRSITYAIIGTRKNTGLASAIALSFLGQRASFPTAIFAIIQISYLIWQGFYLRKRVGKP
jgi:BASS family bile acid:Na+ symporter